MRITVEYDPDNGHVFRDNEAEAWVNEIIETARTEDRDDWVVTVGSALLIDYFRLQLAREVLTVDEILFTYNGLPLVHTQTGRFHHWPKGFCDKTDKILTELLEKEYVPGSGN